MRTALTFTIWSLLLSIIFLCYGIVTRILIIQNHLTNIDSHLQEFQTVLSDTQINLGILSSNLNDIQNAVSDTKSSMSRMEKKVFSLQQSHDDVVEKMKQLDGENALEQHEVEIDIVEPRRTSYRDGPINSKPYSLGKKEIRIEKQENRATGNRQDATPKSPLPVNQFFNKAPRTLQSNRDNSTCNYLFRIEIWSDREIFETSWDLFSSNTDEIVAGEDRMPKLGRGIPYSFQTCIDPGLYTFTIYDSYGDGIGCPGRDSCYTLFINDDIIKGVNFSLKQTHKFSASFFEDNTVCVGNPLYIVPDLGSQPSAKWTLERMKTKEVIDSQTIENYSPSIGYNYTTCVDTGIYTFSISDLEGNELDCGKTTGRCFKLFLNDSEIIQEPPIFPVNMFDFFVNVEGAARETKSGIKTILSPINQLNSDGYDVRVEKILNVIQRLSSGNVLYNLSSPQHRAANFILFEDPLKIAAEDPLLIERYAFSVFLFSTNQFTELQLPRETCKHFDVKCDSKDHIKELNFGRRQINGYLPTELAHLRFLEKIYLQRNNLTGTIPFEIGALSYLKELDLSRNTLSGTVPAEIGNMQNLQFLSLERNSLNGSIPSELGQCQALNYIDFTRANLEGTIPPELFNARNLQRLYLVSNSLTGTIPSQLGNARNLISFTFSDNELTGSIPKEVANLSLVQNMWMNKNRLSGSIPEEIGSCHDLETLNFESNMLTGSIPDIFGDLPSVRWFEASNNRLSGIIPKSVWDNDFRVTIKRNRTPKRIFSPWTGSTNNILALKFNDLTGEVPDEFCDKIDELTLDSSTWFLDHSKVNCSCCARTDQCDLWGIALQYIQCGEGNTHHYNLGDNFRLEIDDLISNSFISERGSKFQNLPVCLSPTGCFNVEGSTENGKIGYSHSSKSLESDTCDAVDVCGILIDQYHPKRIGLNHLMQTIVPSPKVLENPDSPHYKALCWMMGDGDISDKLFHEFDTCDATLMQRYAIAVSLFSQETLMGNPNVLLDISNKKTCKWNFIECDLLQDKYVERIILNDQNMTALGPEIGKLERLQTFNFSGNSMGGRLNPATFQSWTKLEILDLSRNVIEGEIPKDLVMMPQLKIMDLSDNKLVGTIPSDVEYSTNLRSFNVSNNLLQGTLPTELIACHKLESLDLSRNNIDGTIPTGIGLQHDLLKLDLHANAFSGSIPSHIFNLTNLTHLMLQANDFTGSIPTEVETLNQMQNLALDHNRLKGQIPPLGKMPNIELLHFHHNQLTGNAPNINETTKLRSYITDCGFPQYSLPGSLECESCTTCCNSDDRCQFARSWAKLPIQVVGVMFAHAVPLSLIFISIMITKKKTGGGNLKSDAIIFAKDSVYHFILSEEKVAKVIFVCTAVIQFLLYYFFLEPSELRSENTDYQFSFICAENDLECRDLRSVGTLGWIMFSIVTIIYLGPDFVISTLQIRMAIHSKDIWLLLSGYVVALLASLAFFTSAVYNIALAESSTDLIVNAVILLFISDVDEKVLIIFGDIWPNWTDSITEEVEKKTEARVMGTQEEKSPEDNEI